MRITILAISVNPEFFDIAHIAGMGYDEAKMYFTNSLCDAFTMNEYVLDTSRSHYSSFHAEGVEHGDGSDTMFNWVKVEKNIKTL